MNNDAKDVIGRLRAVNLTLVLLQTEQFDFPLDDTIRRILAQHQLRFQQMLKLVSDLTSFGDMREELLSSLDDILDPASSDYYTQDHLDMLLSLYQGRKEIVRANYADLVSRKALLTEMCRSKIHELLGSIMWLRIAFYSCCSDVALPSLNRGWRAFCAIAIDIGHLSFGDESSLLFVSSLRSWRSSESVVAALEKVKTGGMPHDAAFFKALQEVDDILEVA